MPMTPSGQKATARGADCVTSRTKGTEGSCASPSSGRASAARSRSIIPSAPHRKLAKDAALAAFATKYEESVLQVYKFRFERWERGISARSGKFVPFCKTFEA